MNERVPPGARSVMLLLDVVNRSAVRPTVIPLPDAWDRLMATMPAREAAVKAAAAEIAKLPNWPRPRPSDVQADFDEDQQGDYR